MWRNICAESPVGGLEEGIKELQEVFQKIKSKPNLRRKTSHQNFGGTTTNLSVPGDISSPKIQKEYKSLEQRPPTSKA
jgi:hypothetical protein